MTCVEVLDKILLVNREQVGLFIITWVVTDYDFFHFQTELIPNPPTRVLRTLTVHPLRIEETIIRNP